ncbi:MAG: class I SAM-dependent methyltransferase [Winogradskyella sp.]|uniref:class I SAM-dependent methyltransferase n=1 Tax=Winogradskyella sp. TaxID=1883156 RepID=UPI0025E035B4|nr:class I SAM-dependent methyltransferase [Winogradskyella sp.]NRB59411.1 class I SAM-dependent methyltransferase [Winogradskyella sp.]
MLHKRIKQFINYRRYLDKIHRSNDDIYALQIIQKLFENGTYLPFTPFSLNPYTIVHVLNDIILNQRKQIVEFGSGISTIIIAQFIKVNNLDTKILSIDHNKNWQEIVVKEVGKYSATDALTLLHAEIKKNKNPDFLFYNNNSWYENEVIEAAIEKLEDIDLVVVDGPSTAESIYMRYPALPSLKKKLASSFCVFLDDIRRIGEKEIAEQWNKQCQGQLKIEKIYATISKGHNFSTKPLSH